MAITFVFGIFLSVGSLVLEESENFGYARSTISGACRAYGSTRLE